MHAFITDKNKCLIVLGNTCRHSQIKSTEIRLIVTRIASMTEISEIHFVYRNNTMVR